MKPDHRTEIKDYLGKAFTPGSFLEFMEYKKVELLKGSYAELLDKVLAISSKEDLADFQEGYWVDHWIYNNDLLEQYFSIYPDRIEDLLVKDCSYTYYDNYEVVMPREKKYVLTPNGVRQLGSVIRIREKEELIKSRETHPYMVRTENGKEIFTIVHSFQNRNASCKQNRFFGSLRALVSRWKPTNQAGVMH